MYPSMRRFIATALLLLVPSIASADARKDITNLRHGRADSHQQFLGWNADGDAVARKLVCSEGGELMCWASIDALNTNGTERTTILWHNEASMYEEATASNPKGPIPLEEATSFIRSEKRVLERTGSLRTGSAVPDPAQAFGSIRGEPTEVYLRTSAAPDGESLLLHIAVRGPEGASVDLEALDNSPWHVDSQEVVNARVSPDGSAVWVAMHYTDGVMCWDGEDIEFTVAARGEVRAKLANAAGLRAYRDGRLDEARELFETATSEDPSYAWGWFNRGAVQSLEGDLDAAATSLQTAIELDPSHEDRACGDDDYAALRATDAGRAMIDCGYEEGC